MNFEPYPFEKLAKLLDGIEPSTQYAPLALTIGEPQFETPEFIQEGLKEKASLLNKYPKSSGEDFLYDAIKTYLSKRFDLSLKNSQIIPTFGTREVLFNFPQFLLFDKPDPVMAFPNPFYQIYEGAAIASRAKVIHLDLDRENNFLPKIDKEALKNVDLVILNSPNNPTSSVMSFDDMEEWIKLALEYDFVLLNDECYIDLYIDEPLPSLLNVSKQIGNVDYKNILVANSISKRSSAPGLRSGFLAGDENILKEYMKYRTYVGCASPLPLQYASALAWSDKDHADFFRNKYKKNFEIAKDILGITPPLATFYIWLKVDDEFDFTKKLYKDYNLKVLPGSLLGRSGAGSGYVRLALVYDEETTKDALIRIKQALKKD
ncbi:MAG: succinyldiaminopimelate transaminase [Epsilonproteobacteria bacterium]|nr:succinyldiaminopimelate transaminase [Campylobacterota bacterium]